MIWGIRILNTMILEKYKIKTFDKLKKKIMKKKKSKLLKIKILRIEMLSRSLMHIKMLFSH